MDGKIYVVVKKKKITPDGKLEPQEEIEDQEEQIKETVNISLLFLLLPVL